MLVNDWGRGKAVEHFKNKERRGLKVGYLSTYRIDEYPGPCPIQGCDVISLYTSREISQEKSLRDGIGTSECMAKTGKRKESEPPSRPIHTDDPTAPFPRRAQDPR